MIHHFLTLIPVVVGFIFFFVREVDGIRVGHVTGVQTCALPIFRNVLKTLNSEYLLDIFEKPPHYFIRTKENRLAKKLEEEIGRASCRERKKRSDVNRTRKKQ